MTVSASGMGGVAELFPMRPADWYQPPTVVRSFVRVAILRLKWSNVEPGISVADMPFDQSFGGCVGNGSLGAPFLIEWRAEVDRSTFTSRINSRAQIVCFRPFL